MNVPEEVICSTIRDVLGEMCFAESEFVQTGELAPGALAAAIRVATDGGDDAAGEMTLRMSPALAHQLACDFLALDPAEVTADQQRSLVLELANVLCGTTLSNWKPEHAFRVSLPEAVEPSHAANLQSCHFRVLGEQPDLALTFAVDA